MMLPHLRMVHGGPEFPVFQLRIDKPIFQAEQGHWMGRPGIASVEVIGEPDDIQTVKVGGTAVAILQGELML